MNASARARGLPDDAREALIETLGPAGCLTEAADVAKYTVDFRGLYHGATPLVARPDSVETVRAVVRIADHFNVGIVPYGG
ncbi:MAG TPA: hydroxyacid dehydrogenase, partial [Candidatus Dormibacteraeota bacterium]|nr:hydroxyacid dehydrogenase [Candidatus Dormibacteraeota bacterium]